MLVPGTEFPHLCTQCEDYPCVKACLFKALSVNEATSAVTVNAEKCTGCGKCIEACPGKVPHVHPKTNKVLICDLCGGDPQCAKVCGEGGWNCLGVVERDDREFKLFARVPEETARALAIKLYGEKAEEFF
jgi:Fe-S-cluster-containing dehydrogenase component